MKNWENKWRNGFTVAESTAITNQPIELQYTWIKITHDGFMSSDIRQQYVQYAYELWWFDFVRMIECENGNRSPFAVWDNWHAFGFCQMNNNYHKIPQEYFEDWKYQLEYCYKKWSSWTKYYWPSRIIKWMRCDEYVKNRFTFVW